MILAHLLIIQSLNSPGLRVILNKQPPDLLGMIEVMLPRTASVVSSSALFQDKLGPYIITSNLKQSLELKAQTALMGPSWRH